MNKRVEGKPAEILDALQNELTAAEYEELYDFIAAFTRLQLDDITNAKNTYCLDYDKENGKWGCSVIDNVTERERLEACYEAGRKSIINGNSEGYRKIEKIMALIFAIVLGLMIVIAIWKPNIYISDIFGILWGLLLLFILLLYIYLCDYYSL